MGEFDKPQHDDWREREDLADSQRPDPKEQRDENVRTFHPLHPSELEQRRLRRAERRPRPYSGDEAA